MAVFVTAIAAAFIVVFALFFMAIFITLRSTITSLRKEATLLRQRRRLDNAWEQLNAEERAEALQQQRLQAQREAEQLAIYDGGGW